MIPRSSLFSLIGSAWAFQRKHPVCASIVLWLSALPLTAVDLLRAAPESPDRGLALVATGTLLVAETFILVWAQASTLLVARRMLQNKAGRARTSLKSVARESAPFVLPLLLTALLRVAGIIQRGLLFVLPGIALLLLRPEQCVQQATLPGTLAGCWPALLLLPLLLPAVLYGFRSVFWDVGLMLEGTCYRDALRRSLALTKGRTWSVCGTMLALLALLVVPAEIVAALLRAFSEGNAALTAGALLLGNVAREWGAQLLALALVAYYGRLRSLNAADAVHALQEDIPV